jgi:hypothetical protein
MRMTIPYLLAVAVALTGSAVADFYVGPDGDDAFSGTKPEADGEDGPFATLTRARDAIRELRAAGPLPEGGVTVWLHGGDYIASETFTLTAEDGGTREAPVRYSAMPGETVRFIGGRVVSGFAPVTDTAVLGRLPEHVRGDVLQLDLRAAGVSDFGELRRHGFGMGAGTAALELFFDGEPMTLARWPNEDWARIGKVPEDEEGVFLYSEDAPCGGWREPELAWVHGYWTWPWADSHEQVVRIDPERRAIHTREPHGVYGYKPDRRFYAYNILEELDQPGEYHVDRAAGMLYFLPPANPEGVEVMVSVLEDPFVVLDGADYVTLEGFTFIAARGSGLTVRGGEGNRVRDCTFANLGNSALSITPHDGRDAVWNGVENCVIYNVGGGGISIDGGNRETLSPGANFAVNNHIHHFSRRTRTYTAAIQLGGVRNRAAHNLIHDAPHMAIGYGGNEHLIEYNEIHHVCMETGDAGATYIGRDWTHLGNVVRFNYFHNLGSGAGDHSFSDVQAIYLDDFICGTLVHGNVVVGAGRAVLIGGGRGNTVDNNIFVRCKVGVHIDQRGLGWASNYFDGGYRTLFERFDAMNAGNPPYSLRYPELATLQGDEPAAAKYNHVLRNVFVDCPNWLNLQDGLTPEMLDLADNWTEGDPGFVDAAAMDFRLRDDAPVYALGFQRIPWERIGRQK